MGSKGKITRRRALLAGTGTLGFGGAVAYLASRSGSSAGEYVPETSHPSDGTTGFGVELAGRPIAGQADAPVDVYYWTDYLCPFCKRFETETLPKVGRNYVDAGDVRLVALAFPVIGEYSTPAAVWGRCVWETVAADEPAAFWRWHGAAFDAQERNGNDWATAETFRGITERTAGVSLDAVEECRQSRGDAVRESITVDAELARSVPFRGTPGFVIYNRESDAAGKITGAQPYENFADAIDRVLDA
ncbi:MULTISPECIES: DsbA family protein [Halolamina]|uniref:Protein-disulfide isomerase n=1 Tax=Halolamina pelagica TaxID=699431 RepID=A0A1I5TLW8_9EURY|nr:MULTISPECIES: DsbA family protein [Halolamina]NHX37730.1 DsbA family protein [Halolamina sp. R1-12]SFP84049.1 Protein-disulfide isomerase [Halolamina pelagica]